MAGPYKPIMNFAQSAPSPLAYFSLLVHSDEDFPLLEAAASIAQDEYPELDVQQVLGDVDQLLARARRRVPADADEVQKLRVLNQMFYRDLGFAGNVNDYYDPDNSYLNAVLRTRRGIPIALAVLWMELASGLGFSVFGVGFPGHFMVKVELPRGPVMLDPFTGRSLSREDLMERLEPFQREAQAEGDFEVPLGLYLQAMPARQIIARMLRNLKEIYKAQEDWQRLLPVLDRLVVLLPDSSEDLCERGLVHAELGHAPKAVADLQDYLRRVPAAPDALAISQRLEELRQWLD